MDVTRSTLVNCTTSGWRGNEKTIGFFPIKRRRQTGCVDDRARDIFRLSIARSVSRVFPPPIELSFSIPYHSIQWKKEMGKIIPTGDLFLLPVHLKGSGCNCKKKNHYFWNFCWLSRAQRFIDAYRYHKNQIKYVRSIYRPCPIEKPLLPNEILPSGRSTVKETSVSNRYYWFIINLE